MIHCAVTFREYIGDDDFFELTGKLPWMDKERIEGGG